MKNTVDIIIHFRDENGKPICGAEEKLTDEQIKGYFFTKPSCSFQGVWCLDCGEIKVFEKLDEFSKEDKINK